MNVKNIYSNNQTIRQILQLSTICLQNSSIYPMLYIITYTLDKTL